MKSNVIGWVEVPVNDMNRAIKFYEEVFGFKIELHILGPLEMGWFPWVDKGEGSGCALVKHQEYKPSADGVVVYFTSHTGDLENELSKVEKAGGTVLMPKKKISDEHGFMALFTDTEGNRVALHSGK